MGEYFAAYLSVLLTIAVQTSKTLIHRWHAQSSAHALNQPPQWIFIQLPRTIMTAQGPGKHHEAYKLSTELLLPCFRGHVTLETRWESNKLLACVTHHGEHLETGHYRVLVSEGTEHWILDDARQIKKASSEQLGKHPSACTSYSLQRSQHAPTMRRVRAQIQ